MNLCYLIADQIHRLRALREPEQGHARQKDDGAYWRWQYESSRDYFAKFFDLEGRLGDAEVIDIGCGLEARTCYLAKQGVRRIVGTDTNHVEIDRAIQLAEQLGDSETRQAVGFEKVNENETNSNSMQFDVALLVDSLEHVRSPAAMLDQAYSLLKPGGTCYFSTWGCPLRHSA